MTHESNVTRAAGSPAASTDVIAAAVTRALAAKGWTIGNHGPYAVGRKTFLSVGVEKHAHAYLYPGDGFNRSLNFQYESEGRNVASAAGWIIPTTSTEDQAYALASDSADRAETAINASYGVRMTKIIEPDPQIDDALVRAFVEAVNPLVHPLPPPAVIRAGLAAVLAARPTPRVGIRVEGGAIQTVFSSQPLTVDVISYEDEEDQDDESVHEVEWVKGQPVECMLHHYSADVLPDQFLAIDKALENGPLAKHEVAP